MADQGAYRSRGLPVSPPFLEFPLTSPTSSPAPSPAPSPIANRRKRTPLFSPSPSPIPEPAQGLTIKIPSIEERNAMVLGPYTNPLLEGHTQGDEHSIRCLSAPDYFITVGTDVLLHIDDVYDLAQVGRVRFEYDEEGVLVPIFTVYFYLKGESLEVFMDEGWVTPEDALSMRAILQENPGGMWLSAKYGDATLDQIRGLATRQDVLVDNKVSRDHFVDVVVVDGEAVRLALRPQGAQRWAQLHDEQPGPEPSVGQGVSSRKRKRERSHSPDVGHRTNAAGRRVKRRKAAYSA